MLALMHKLSPNGLDELEYLDMLYDRVTKADRGKADDARIETQVNERLKAALKKMEDEAAGAERPTPESRVTRGPSRTPTIEEAWDAAKRGERFE